MRVAWARRPVAFGALLLLGTWGATFAVRPWSDERINDWSYLRADAIAFVHGHLPYADRAFEYPPLAAPVLALPAAGGTGQDGYRLAFAALMLAFAGAVLWACARLARSTGGSERLAVAGVALSPLLIGAVLRGHFDLAAVALLAWALVALVEGRPRLGMALLGAGALTKVFPLAAAPVALAWLAGRARGSGSRPGRLRARISLTGAPTPAALALVAVLAGGAALAVALSPSGAVDVLRYHFDRPPQVESTPAVALLVLDALGAHTTTVVSSFGSQGVPGSGASGLAAAFAVAGVAAVALLAARAYARPEPRELVLGSLAAVAAFAAFGKVLSPQFAAWIVPLLALALAWRDWALAAVTACAMTLTLFEFPFRYWDLVAGRSGAVALVAARDVAMLGAVALSAIAMRPGSARALRPSAAPPPAPARSA